MKINDSISLNIAIVWEQLELGGVDSYLFYLLDNWPNKDDSFTIFFNRENSGAKRLIHETKFSNLVINFVEVESFFINSKDKNKKRYLIESFRYFLRPLLFIKSIFYYRRIFRKNKFDVVLVQNGGYPGSYGNIAAIFGADYAGIGSKSLVIHHAAQKPDFLQASFRLILEKKLAPKLTSLITVSNATKQTIINNTRILDDQNCSVTVIDNGIPFVSNHRKIKENKVNKIAILGRLELYKGHDDLLCSMSLLDDKILDKISIDFIGKYNQSDFVYLKQLSKNLDLDDKLRILGFVEGNYHEIIRGYDLIVMLTKTFEGFGLTVIEALSNNIPVMATRVGIVEDVFPDSHPLLVEIGDYDSIANALEVFVKEKNKMSFITGEMIKNIENYNAKKMSKKYRQHLLFDYIKTQSKTQ